MNLTQKKCFVAATGIHALLVVILFVGPAFRSEPKVESVTPLTVFDPSLLTDSATGGGAAGAPGPAPVTPTPTQAPTPTPTPVPVQAPPSKAVEPTPVVPTPPKPKPPEPVKEPDDDTFDPVPPSHPTITPNIVPTPRKVTPKPPKERTPPIVKRDSTIKIDDNDLVETSDSQKKRLKLAAELNDRKARERAEKAKADHIKGIQRAFNDTKRGISDIEIAPAGSLVRTGTGPSGDSGMGGGPAAANYRDVIFTYYYRAWTAPDSVSDTRAETEVKVVVARNGSIISATISNRSGVTAMDNSVKRALNSVKSLPPFPAGATDSQRTFIIVFNLKAKLSDG